MDKYGKSLKFGLLLIIVASLVALFVTAVFVDNGLTVRTPSDRANLSGTATYLNASINASNQNVTNLTFVFTLLSNGTNSYNFTDINDTGGSLGNDTSFNFTINTVTSLPDGSYNVTLYAYNVSGSALVNSTALVNVTVDNTAPVASFSGPNVSSVEPTNVSVTATFINLSALIYDMTLGVYQAKFNISNDSTGAASRFYTAGLLSGTGGQNSSWNASVNLTDLPAGELLVTINATDTNNNTNASKTMIIRIDRTVPSMMFLNSTGVNTSSGRTFNTTDTTPNASFTVIDNLYKNLTCSLLFGNVSYNTSNVNNGTEVYLTANASVSQGSQTVSVNCTDGSGNKNSTQSGEVVAFNLTVDSIAPVVYFVGPNVSANEPKNISLTTNTTVLNVTVTDATLGVYVVMFNITNVTNNRSIANNTGDLQSATAFHWNYTLSLTTFADGEYQVSVVTNDTLNNRNNTQHTWLRVDRTPPVVTINATRFNITDATPVITFNYTDNVYKNSSCVLFIGNVSYNSSARFVNDTKSNYTMNTTLADGSYDVSINCTDGSGVQGASAAVNVTVNASEMFSIGMDGVTSSGGTLLVNVSNTSQVNNCTFNDGTNSASNMTRVSVGTSAYTATITGLASATTHTLTVTCWDAFGNSFANTTPSFTTLAGTTASSSSSSSGGGSVAAKSTSTDTVAEESVADATSAGTGSSSGAGGAGGVGRGAGVGSADQAAGAADAAAAAEAARQALAGQAISAKLRAIFTDYSALWLVGVVVLLAVVGVVYWIRMRRD